MVAGIFVLLISIGAIAAGWGYVRTAKRMRSYAVTRGQVVSKELATLSVGAREGRYGDGGNYTPKVTYRYEVDGRSFQSDRSSYAKTGLKKQVAEQRLAAIGDEVDVFYDPADPAEAYLERSTPRTGTLLVAGGSVGVLVGLAVMLG